ncbi:MAG TPA: putative toxin-antitoxin system toxin component, PIN family [Candidatus Sulfotelmatobacter sp.]|jgi:putative PIN family toxin of toxin-antitoxin system
MIRRVVFDTTTVVSALIFASGRLAWLRAHWRQGDCVPIVSRSTATELTRVLRYAKFKLSVGDAQELLADYLPHCEVIQSVHRCPVICRDPKDQPFLDLAHGAKADVLVTGDRDLLALSGRTDFVVETPEAYRRRATSAT